MRSSVITQAERDTPEGQSSLVVQLTGIRAGYGKVTVLRDVDLDVAAGKIVAVLGPNGAGKTTLLKTAAGLLRPMSGSVVIGGKDLTRSAPNRRARAGLCLIPEGRGVFRNLSVRENLRLQIPHGHRDSSFERALDAFPDLKKRLGQIVGTMSGGQQQMLALSRAYLARPRVVMVDEVSMGLAPMVVDEMFAALRRLAATGAALVLVEQYVNRALALADHVVLLDRGRVAYDGPVAGLDQETVLSGYLGAR
jgi:branched-chain amino acid transport system ATP-binding protein